VPPSRRRPEETLEGADHADRDAQFQHLNEQVKQLLARHQPVISVDTKKKELVGEFKNSGRELRPKGDPEKGRLHDFVIQELGRAAPYGVYDMGANTGWVSVGSNHDTVSFAVEMRRVATLGLSSAAGHEQMEQERTPPFLFHQPKLERQAPGQSPSDRRPHRRRRMELQDHSYAGLN